MATRPIAPGIPRDTAARRGASVALLALLGMGQTTPPAATGGQAVNPQALALKDYGDRVQRYAELHRTLEAELPDLPERADPAAITAHQKALASKIQAARARAKPGDIFEPEVAKQFRRIIRDDLERRSAQDVRAMFEEIPKGYEPRVNAPYPSTAPLSMVPPMLLAKLQRLPEELEYRLMDRSLILRDTHANLIVDFVDRVVPSTLR